MIVVTGADGQLGNAFRNVITDEARFLARAEIDLTELDRIGPVIANLRPTSVINCAAYTDVDGAESDEDTANVVNGYAVGELATACRDVGAQFVTFSTDYAFDGADVGEYVESDRPNPINAYGRSKVMGERLALEVNPESLIIRTSWLLSATHPNFVTTILKRLQEGNVTVVSDQFGRPTVVDDLAEATIEAMGAGVIGILHLANRGVTSWHNLAREIAELAGCDPDRVHPCATADRPAHAKRPPHSVLSSERLDVLGLQPIADYHVALERIVVDVCSAE